MNWIKITYAALTFITVCGACMGSQDLAQSRLTNCRISFHTNDDDKDPDTELTITVYDDHRRVAARASGTFGRFPDHTDTTIPLKIYHPSTLQELQRGSVSIRIDPNGHDTWKFNYFLQLIGDDPLHTQLSGGQDGLVLSQDHRDYSAGLDGLVDVSRRMLNSNL